MFDIQKVLDGRFRIMTDQGSEGSRELYAWACSRYDLAQPLQFLLGRGQLLLLPMLTEEIMSVLHAPTWDTRAAWVKALTDLRNYLLPVLFG